MLRKLPMNFNFSDRLWTQEKTRRSASSISPLVAQEIAEWMNSEMFKMFVTAILLSVERDPGLRWFCISLLSDWSMLLTNQAQNWKKSHTNVSTFLANGKIASFNIDIWLAPCDIFPFRRDLFAFGFTTVNRIAPNANLTQLIIDFSALAYGR